MTRGIRYLKGRIHAWRQRRAKYKMLADCHSPVRDFTHDDWVGSLSNPTGFYVCCFQDFHQRLPGELQEHWKYFTTQGRGFGEDVFHVMWYLLFREFKPKNFLKIGVFRGQTISLIALLVQEIDRSRFVEILQVGHNRVFQKLPQ